MFLFYLILFYQDMLEVIYSLIFNKHMYLAVNAATHVIPKKQQCSSKN
jgi:hypothetical protein